MTEMTACRTPTKGRNGATNIPTWKFDLLRGAMLGALADGPMTIADLKDRVSRRLTSQDIEKLGSLMWHMMAVKLELEVRGDIERISGKTPQQIGLPQGS